MVEGNAGEVYHNNNAVYETDHRRQGKNQSQRTESSSIADRDESIRVQSKDCERKLNHIVIICVIII